MPISCDTMVALSQATVKGQTLFAKNSDRPARECQPLIQKKRLSHSASAVAKCQFVELPQARTTYCHVGSKPHWCWGYEHGFNEHQVVIGNEGLASKITYPKSEPKLIGMEVLRLGLERAQTAVEAVEMMTDVITRYGQGKFDNDSGVRTYDNGYIVADPHEAYVIETAGHQWAVKKVERAIGISNVYSVETDWSRISPDAESYATDRGWWRLQTGRFNFAQAYSMNQNRSEGSGAMRRIRSCTVLGQKSGKVEVHTMMSLLSDHSDGKSPDEPFQTDLELHRGGICVHGNADGTGGNTAASLVADLCSDGSRLPVYWCSFYSPCLGIFLPLFVEGELPEVLSIGDATLSGDSPWWLFYRLSRAVRAESKSRIPEVRERWSKFQTRLFETAYQFAHEGRRLIDDGKSESALRLLTGYMAENVRIMLGMVSEMLTVWEGS